MLFILEAGALKVVVIRCAAAGKENAAKGATAAKRKLAEDALQSQTNGTAEAAAQPNGKDAGSKRAKVAKVAKVAANGASNGAANGAASGHAAEPAADTPVNRSGRQVGA